MTSASVEWAIGARTRGGERDSGDRCLAMTLPEGALLAVADGLGHGAEAALASDLAIRTIERHARQPVVEIVQRCHMNLRRTRGAALSLARWSAADRTLEWIGIGNVEGLLMPADSGARARRDRLVLRGGVVGGRLPALHAATVGAPEVSLLLLATDGITGGFDEGLDPRARPQALADRILKAHSKDTDDALVLVARLGG